MMSKILLKSKEKPSARKEPAPRKPEPRKPKMATYEVRFHHYTRMGKRYAQGDKIKLDPEDPLVKQAVANGQLVQVK